MDTLYRLLEWNPVQVGSTFQGRGGGGVLSVIYHARVGGPGTPPLSVIYQGLRHAAHSTTNC